MMNFAANPFKTNPLVSKQKEKYGWVFGLTFITAVLVFLPFLIMDRGYFLFYGDFNVQQIPFYVHAHDMVRSGSVLWDFQTDLGANFIGSYTFYLLGSPFFWLTIPFPSEVVPYLMGPLIWLKLSCAAVTGYGFITRFVRNKEYAMAGAILYAFSGFSVYNIFFNHFHEAIVFFPLLLIALEEELVNDRRGVFLLAVALNAMVNYYFFVGQVMFVVFYFIMRVSTDELKFTLKQFFHLAVESVLGVMLAAFLIMPSAIAIMGNPRSGEYLSGWNFWLYGNVQRYMYTIQCFFFTPDIPARPNFFPDSNAKWSSVAAYLPFFSMSGVIAYCQSKKNNGFKRIIYLCIFLMLVPGLNGVFYLFNGSNSTYTRWFYMLTLIMATVTVSSLEDSKVDFARGIKWTAIITAFFTFMVGLTPVTEEGETTYGLEDYPDRFWLAVIIAFASLGILYLLYRYYKSHKHFGKAMIACSLVASAFMTFAFIVQGKLNSDDEDWIIDVAINGSEKINLPDDEFYRIDLYDSMDNTGLFWQIPNIQAFHSIVPASVMEFYPTIGVDRGVGSRPEISRLGLRSLVSVKYLFVKEGEKKPDISGFEIYDTQNQYDIYENTNFVPMGFTYTSFMDEDQYDSVSQNRRDQALMKAILLSDETIEKYDGILPQIADDALSGFDDEHFEADCSARREESASYFAYDSKGFEATIDLDQENLVFFSVPYDDGWTATVNGEPAEIEKVNVGFMAVRCGAGGNDIRFDYVTPGLKTGFMISGAALLLIALYLVYLRREKRKARVLKVASGQSSSGEARQPDDDPEVYSTGSIDLTQIHRPDTLPDAANENVDSAEKSESVKSPEEDQENKGEDQE